MLQQYVHPLTTITINDLARGIVAFTIVDLGLVSSDAEEVDDVVAWIVAALLHSTGQTRVEVLFKCLHHHLIATGLAIPPALVAYLRLRLEVVTRIILQLGIAELWEPFVLTADERYGCRNWMGLPEGDIPARPTASPEIQAACHLAA